MGWGALGAEAQTWVLTCSTVDHDVLVGEKTALLGSCGAHMVLLKWQTGFSP